jgi:hypothetical protein
MKSWPISVWLLVMNAAHAGAIARAVEKFPDLPAPPQGEAQWIARSMRMNGLPMTIQVLYSHSTPDEVVHFYESWAKHVSGAQTKRSHTHDTEILSIRSNSFLITLELQQVVTGTQGTIVTSSPPERATLSTKTDFPHPMSWRVANLQQYDDAGKETEHITFTSAQGPAHDAQIIADLLASSGWTLVNERASSANAFLVEAQHDAELARIVITSDVDHRVSSLVTVLWSKG